MRELLRQRHEGDGDQLDELLAADTTPNPRVRTTGAESTTGTAYGARATAGCTSSIAPGQYTLAGKIAAATDKDLAVANVTSTLADGKYYSFYIERLYDATAKKVDAFVVEDPIPDDDRLHAGVCALRQRDLELAADDAVREEHATRRDVAIGASCAYKAAGTFTAVPGGVYDLSLHGMRGSNTVVTLARRFRSSPGASTRSHCAGRHDRHVYHRGNKPALDNTANR